MERNCLMINDEALIEKLEYFLYEYSGIVYNFKHFLTNYIIGNRYDGIRIYNIDNIYKLRKMLSYNCMDTKLDEQTLVEAIDLFLPFLRTYSIEATMALSDLLDTIRKTGKEGHEWKCVRRITGILAAVFLLYFVHKAKMFDVNETESNMKSIFQKNIDFYTFEDRSFLAHIFMVANRNDCLIELLQSNLQVCDKDEEYTVDPKHIMAVEFYGKLDGLTGKEKYNDAMLFLVESEDLFKMIPNSVKRRSWEMEKAKLLYNLRKYEEAKNIYDKYINAFSDSKNFFDLYDCAIFYACTAHYKEKNDPDWKIYIENAYQLIIQTENHILQSKNLSEFDNFILCNTRFEKSYLFLEKGEYDNAFEYLRQAFLKADLATNMTLYSNSPLWILMKYMGLHPKKHKIAMGLIEYFYKNYKNVRFKECDKILCFVHSNEYLKNNSGTFSEVYMRLLQLIFHALEIRHETKIRDVSKYDILYYTKVEHLKLLLEDETSDNCRYRLPMFHVYHMNDPQEGKILRGLLKNDEFASVDTEESSDSGNQYEENYVFLKSFFCSPKSSKEKSMKEFLPMWVQYGDDAQGCCVVLNNKTFENNTLHRIVYLTDDGECDIKDKEVKRFLDEFLSTYRELVSLCNIEIDLKSKAGKECFLEIKSLVKYITSLISYLFKNQLYKHENEVRLIVNRTSDELDDVKVIPGSIPKMYIYNDSQTYIDEVILGAKIVNPEDYVPFIYKQGRKMWEKDDKQSQIKVTHSTIQYR